MEKSGRSLAGLLVSPALKFNGRHSPPTRRFCSSVNDAKLGGHGGVSSFSIDKILPRPRPAEELLEEDEDEDREGEGVVPVDDCCFVVTFASEKMAPRFDDPFRHTNFDQRICYNAYMKTMVKNEQPCSSRIFLAALVQIL